MMEIKSSLIVVLLALALLPLAEGGRNCYRGGQLVDCATKKPIQAAPKRKAADPPNQAPSWPPKRNGKKAEPEEIEGDQVEDPDEIVASMVAKTAAEQSKGAKVAQETPDTHVTTTPKTIKRKPKCFKGGAAVDCDTGELLETQSKPAKPKKKATMKKPAKTVTHKTTKKKPVAKKRVVVEEKVEEEPVEEEEEVIEEEEELEEEEEEEDTSELDEDETEETSEMENTEEDDEEYEEELADVIIETALKRKPSTLSKGSKSKKSTKKTQSRHKQTQSLKASPKKKPHVLSADLSVTDWLGDVGLGGYAKNFAKAGFDDLELLSVLSNEEREDMYGLVELKLGHKFKLRRALDALAHRLVHGRESIYADEDEEDYM